MIGFVNVVGVILVEANGGGRCEPRDETPVDVVRLFRISSSAHEFQIFAASIERGSLCLSFAPPPLFSLLA